MVFFPFYTLYLNLSGLCCGGQGYDTDCMIVGHSQCSEKHSVSVFKVEVIGFNPEGRGSLYSPMTLQGSFTKDTVI
jgi:hypothetical protein